jgi:Xaa-Pro dipeptidase
MITSLRQYARTVQLHHKLQTQFLKQFRQAGAASNSAVLLKSASLASVNDTDTDYIFIQDSYFFYLFGVEEADIVGLLEVDSAKIHLFVPKYSENLRYYMVLPTPNSLSEKYSYEAHYLDDFADVLNSLSPSVLYLNKGTNTDSKVTTPTSYFTHQALSSFQTNEDLLYPVLTECRVHKHPEEVEILRRVALAASEAHVEMMKQCKPGMKEFQLAGYFTGHMAVNYGQMNSYSPICGCGHNAVTLHYVDNLEDVTDNSLVLCDLGSRGYGYCSDITRTYPTNGKFTEDQRKVYEAVLDAQQSVIDALAPGVNWVDMHKLAERVILSHLKEIGIVQGDVSEMVEARLGAVFMPHGLGHFLGLDVHDVGGYNGGKTRIDEPGLRNLRTVRDLEEGMVITVEPGCYFIPFAIESALNDRNLARFLNAEVLERFKGKIGVRIEDDVLITSEGSEVLSNPPKSVEEIEYLMTEKKLLIHLL